MWKHATYLANLAPKLVSSTSALVKLPITVPSWSHCDFDWLWPWLCRLQMMHSETLESLKSTFSACICPLRVAADLSKILRHVVKSQMYPLRCHQCMWELCQVAACQCLGRPIQEEQVLSGRKKDKCWAIKHFIWAMGVTSIICHSTF